MISVKWRYRFRHPVEMVWPLISNTDKMNRALGFSEIVYRHEPDALGGSRRFGAYGSGFGRTEWRELPYEWVRGQFFRVDRRYSQGPMRFMTNHCQILDSDETGFTLEQRFEVLPKNWFYHLPVFLIFSRGIRKKFLNVYRYTNAFVDRLAELQKKDAEAALTEKVCPFPPVTRDLVSADATKVQWIRERLLRCNISPALVSRLISFIFETQEPDLVRIRPLALAKAWRMDSKSLLTALLKATEAGIFNLSWDLLCPGCRGAKARPGSLADLKQGVHCESCNIDYSVDFSNSVELSFQVNEAVRKVVVGDFCVGGPQNTPHFLAQILIRPGEPREFQIQLDPGTYRLRTPYSKKNFRLVSEEGAAPAAQTLAFAWADAEEGEITLKIKSGLTTFRLQNQHSGTSAAEPMLAILERTQWIEDACTAAYVTSLQEFRDLFATEVLKAGQEISIQAMALMFTDLKGSTALYNRIGSAQAFSLVRDHFEILMECLRENSGCLVKTIGDAIMGAFLRPEDALKAAIAIHRRIEAKNSDWGDKGPLKLKIGIHFGPCLAVNLNDRLDYFGSAVNIAARTEGQCEGGDIVISQRMFSEPGVQEVLQREKLTPEKIVRSLKGFDQPVDLCKIQVL